MVSYIEAPELGSHLISLERRIASLEATASTQLAGRGTVYTPSLVSGFANFGSGYADAEIISEGGSWVSLRGSVAMPNDFAPLLIFTLPADQQGRPTLRPSFLHDFPFTTEYADSVAAGIITVHPTGEVVLSAGGPGFLGRVPLDVVRFRTS